MNPQLEQQQRAVWEGQVDNLSVFDVSQGIREIRRN